MALESVMQFCSAMKVQHPDARVGYCLSLLGYSGTGKTHLAKAVRDYFKKYILGRQYVPRFNYVSFHDFRFRTWKDVMRLIYDGQWETVEEFKTDWLLILDDVGAEHDPRKIGVSVLLDILDHRQGLWTILTSNLTVQHIAEQLDTRLASRMIRGNNKVVQLECDDWALRKDNQKELRAQ
jgi:DNA replication protein DnaC